MKITGFTVEPINLELPIPLTIAYADLATLEYAMIQLFTDEGIVGIGEASPDPEVTGETQEIVIAAFNAILPKLIGCDPFDIAAIIATCLKEIPHAPAATTAIDMALYDLMGKKLGIPAYQLMGGKSRSGMSLYPVIPINEPEIMAGMVKKFADMGADRFKIKLGTGPEEDYQRLKLIRETLGPDAELRLDINQGWGDAATAIQAINAIAEFNIKYVEQPTKDVDLEGLAEVTAAVDIPIMADESCHGPADVYKIAAMGAADMINIKLMKCGGIYEGMKMLAIAQVAGLPCILGSMLETCVGSAAGLHFSIAQTGITACELVGPMFISNDPSQGFNVDEKTLQAIPLEVPGLGVSLK